MEWKSATIFISSTFNDMHAERDYLIKEVFPELSEWCEERKIRLSDVDLRWGVKEEDSENNTTVEKCLKHIDKSRPFFLCFLGQRRGWVPDMEKDINKDTKDTYPSIKNIEGDVSVTEMEIEHSLLSPMYRILKDEKKFCPPTRHTLFFFRDPSYLDEITHAQRLIYTNDKEDDSAHADEKLAETKDRIIKRAEEEKEKNKIREEHEKTYVDVNHYKGVWDKDLELPELKPVTIINKEGEEIDLYTEKEGIGRLTNFTCGDRSLKDVLIEQLKEQLEAEFPENMEIEEQSELEKDLYQQDIFTFLNSEGFIKRPEYTSILKDYVNSDENKSLIVSAEAGFGKTMLLAKFATDFNANFKNKRLYKRFCGASDLSSQIFSLWKSIIDEAGIRISEKYYPDNIDNLKRNIKKILEEIANKGDSVIIIDAVNQMPNGINMLKWLPPLPENLKIIISIKEDKEDEGYSEELNKIKKRDVFSTNSFIIKELNNDSKKELIHAYLKNYLKELDEAEINTICDFEGSKNPLYLKILLAELRVFGSFDQLKDEIKTFGDNPIEAFIHVFERLDYDGSLMKEENIVPLIFSLLATARVGLSEDEMVIIIKNEKDLDEKYIRDTIRLFIRQVRPFMAKKEGNHDFFYESFKLAAKERYADRISYNHELLADYFKNAIDPSDDFTFKGDNLRDYNEAPYHLNEAGFNDILEKTLSSYLFIKNKLELSDIYNLIGDYDYKYIKYKDEEEVDLVFIKRALELSAPVLIEDQSQLASQLFGRMIDLRKDYEIINHLLDGIENDSSSNMWLKPRTNSLYSPKSSIIKRPKVEGNESCSFIKITDDKKLLVANEDGTLNLFDLETNDLDVIEESTENSSSIIKIIPKNDKMLVASSDGVIRELDIENKSLSGDYPKIDAELTDIYYSKTYGKIYASSHTGIFSIDLDSNMLRKEDIEEKNYNHILVPRRNESILVCDEKEVDGWDIDTMRKSYNRIHLQNIVNDEVEGSIDTKMDSSENIKFMGLNKRFLTLISENGQMKLWNSLKKFGGGETISDTFVCSLNDKFAQAITLDDEDQIISISDMGVLRVWDIPHPKRPKFNKTIDIQTGIKAPTSIEYLKDDIQWVIIGNKNNDINVIDLTKEIEGMDEVKHTESVLSIKFDGNRMITASNNGELYTWDLNSGECMAKFTNDFRCNAISFNIKDSKLVLAGIKQEKDGTKINKIATCNLNDEMWVSTNEIRSLKIKDRKIRNKVIDVAQNERGVVFLEKNKLTIGDDEIKLNNNATSLTTKFNSMDAFVGFENGNIVKYPSEGSFDKFVDVSVTKIKILDEKLIAGFANGSIEIFNLDGVHLGSFVGHKKAITNFNINNSHLFSVSEDNTLKLWDIKSNECKNTYFLDIFATSMAIQEGKLIIGDTLGNMRFFKII